MLHSTDPVRAHLLLLVYSLLISSSFPLASFLGSSYSPVVTTLARFAIAALGFMLLLAWRSQLYWPGLLAIGRYAVISLPLTSFFLLMFIAGETSSSLALGSLSTLVPLFSFLFAWLFWRQRPDFKRVSALLAGVLGALWVLTEGNFSRLGQIGWPPGNTVFVVACSLMGLYPLVLKQLHRGESMLMVTSWSSITGAGWLLIATALWQPEWQWPTLAQAGAILWLAIFTTMVTFFLFQLASIVVGGSSANAYSLLTPVIVILLNVFLGQSLPSAWVLPGVLLVIFALCALLYQDRQVSKLTE